MGLTFYNQRRREALLAENKGVSPQPTVEKTEKVASTVKTEETPKKGKKPDSENPF